MRYTFRTPDSPIANGRKPLVSEERFPMYFPTDDKGLVTIEMGRSGLVRIIAAVLALLEDYPELRREAQQISIKEQY